MLAVIIRRADEQDVEFEELLATADDAVAFATYAADHCERRPTAEL